MAGHHIGEIVCVYVIAQVQDGLVGRILKTGAVNRAVYFDSDSFSGLYFKDDLCNLLTASSW